MVTLSSSLLHHNNSFLAVPCDQLDPQTVPSLPPHVSHAAREEILRHRGVVSSSSSYHNSISHSARPGVGSYAFPKSVSDSRVSSRTPISFLQHAERDNKMRQNQSQEARQIPQRRTQLHNSGSTSGATSASRSFISESTRSNGAQILEKSVASSAVFSTESGSESDTGSESSSSVAPPVPPKTYSSAAATGNVTINKPAPKLVFEKVNSSVTMTKTTMLVHESSV